MQCKIFASLGWETSTSFLEHFRYMIVASQLLNDHFSRSPLQNSFRSIPSDYQNLVQAQSHEAKIGATPGGLLFIIILMFGFVGFIQSFQQTYRTNGGSFSLFIIAILWMVLLKIMQSAVRQQRLHSIRARALRSASRIIAGLKSFDVATSTCTRFIQEAELISRGYSSM